MAEHNALDYVSALTGHPQNFVFEAAREVEELFQYYEDEFGN